MMTHYSLCMHRSGLCKLSVKLWFDISGRLGVLQSMGLQTVSYDWVTESEVAQSCPTLCDTMNCSLPASSIHGIFQARILEWVAMSFSRVSSWPRDWTWVSYIAGRLFTVWATRESLTGQLNNNKCLKNLCNCALTSDGQNSPQCCLKDCLSDYNPQVGFNKIFHSFLDRLLINFFADSRQWLGGGSSPLRGRKCEEVEVLRKGK